jgi:RsiW-degrading membrane proteinase PrsW (M82 family)
LLSLIAIALAPALAIALFIYSKDKHEREPLGLLLKCFFLGGVSIVPAIFLELFFGPRLSLNEYWSHNFVHAFIVVGFSEEFSKYIFFKRFAYNRAEFNEPFDGIIYSVMVSLGFAALENVMYVMDGGIGVGLLRMFTAVPAHAANAVMMGYFAGLAKFNPQREKTLLITGILAATFFHGAYDFCLFVNEVPVIAFGALITLVVVIVLSRKAIKMHSDNSPFRPENVFRAKP